MKVAFLETQVFTRQITEAMTDEEFARLQEFLGTNPDAGNLIVGGGGLRKLRWAARGRGKRGGNRLIYYWAVAPEQIFLLYLYPKNEKEDLAPAQIKILRAIVEEEFK